MKKILLTILIIGIFLFNNKTEAVVIPNDAIRLRVIPNSNSSYDQEIKMKVSKVLQQNLYNLLKDIKGSSNAREVINENLDEIDKSINELLIKEKYDLGYKINYGDNYFPEKEYKGIKYEEGNYESLLVTLGSGTGDNWWCVLFPPLCLIEADESETEEVEYKFFIQELIEKYL